ncbi:MAG: lipocalin family protein [Comamonas sp.]|jgi:apolipoprotein D and lipocalin family protein|uniref:lipocalin family protein n=1 Tax=Comamonas sp. TaxID=34028 RepID=UPI00284A048A|nr:lipocalin family protein [Comamonas sp.]MDR3067649.1 lipocalin family protein [Comamonas sp.]
MHISRSSFIRATALAAALAGAQALLSGCAVHVPHGVKPVTGFDAKRYMGTWYELARIDHSFEKDLTQVSARYSLNEDGSVSVLNRGFDSVRKEWREAEGKARFLGATDVAALKVSFFGPFYGGYNVVSLDEDYQTSLVIGGSMDYFWILSRHKSMPEQQLDLLLQKARSFGVDLERVTKVAQ